MGFDHAQVTADTTIKLWSPDRKFRIDRVWYNNPTGLAKDATNFFDVQILNAALLAFNWSTETGEEEDLAADTPVDLVVSATDANTVVPADTAISLKLAEGGTATLPAGRVVFEGRYVE